MMDPKQTYICGVIGGMSYHSSSKYPRIIHDAVNQALGGHNCADLMTRDVNFQKIREKMTSDDWRLIGQQMAEIAKWMVDGGAARVAIATNTVHKVAGQVTAEIGEDHFLHIGDSIARQCQKQHAQKVLLLGTAETMSGDFIRGRLEQNGLEVVTPQLAVQHVLNDVIFDELCHGKVKEESLEWYYSVLKNMLATNPIDAIILGCTELSMLAKPFELSHTEELWQYNHGQPFTVIDSTEAQIAAIVQVCLGEWQPTILPEAQSRYYADRDPDGMGNL